MADTQSQQAPQRGWNALMHQVSTHKIETGLLFTRLATVIFSISYIFPIVGNPYMSYYKALMANAATSALRLHQRMPRVQLSREFLAQVLLEDSAHYIFFSLIFLNSEPITASLIPVFLFAVLHAASYSLTLLDALGQNSWWGARMLISLVELQSKNILRTIALTEILMMPLIIVFVFTGRASLLAPFLYYRFIGLRYSSRRNPYTRAMFHELRTGLEESASKPSFPQGVRSLLYRAINFVSGLAPPLHQQ